MSNCSVLTSLGLVVVLPLLLVIASSISSKAVTGDRSDGSFVWCGRELLFRTSCFLVMLMSVKAGEPLPAERRSENLDTLWFGGAVDFLAIGPTIGTPMPSEEDQPLLRSGRASENLDTFWFGGAVDFLAIGPPIGTPILSKAGEPLFVYYQAHAEVGL